MWVEMTTGVGIRGWKIEGGQFKWFELYHQDALNGDPLVLWTGPVEPLWDIVGGPNGKRGIIKNIFQTNLANL
jgi:hypothetical protein